LTDRTVGHSFDDRAFSACALQQKEPLIVLDPLGDVRFRNHPVVTGKPSIRFYVAARLVGRNGRVLGTLSIADTKVRLYVLTAQRVALKDLAAIAVFELEHGSRSY
jgi:GAF domain-containing protein